jgi:PAS domain S-box-containing protein
MFSAGFTLSAPDASMTSTTAKGLDLLSTGFGIFDAAFNLSYCNAPFRELRNLPEALCRPGTPLSEIVRFIALRGDYGPGDAGGQVEQRMAEIMRMQPWQVEQEIPGGRRLSITHAPIPGGGMMITCSDVTEARTTERKLRENEERYGLVSEAVAEGIYDWNIERNTLFVSPRLMEIFGFQGTGLTSQDWYALVHNADRERYRDELRDCFRGNSPRVHCEYRILVRSGEYRWVEDHGLPLRNSEGRAIRLVGAVSDVTGRKETERALRESEERHQLALQAINESVYEWDLVADKMFYSPRLHAALGLTPDELKTAEDWRRRIHPDDLPGYQAATRAHFKGETERFEVEYRYLHSDGTWHWARQHGVALRNGQGRAIRFAGSTGDITHEKEVAIENARLFEEVQARTRELQESLEYQTATSNVLAVISRSPNELQPVLEAIVETAARPCEAFDAIMALQEGEDLQIAAHHGPIPVDFRKWPVGRGWSPGGR